MFMKTASQTRRLPDIAMLWIGPALSFLEQLCILSFQAQGHRVILYSYAEVALTPPGVIQRDAAAILPGDTIRRHERTGSPAVHSDLFRYLLLAREDVIWADTDAYCVKPFDFLTPHVFGILEDRLGIGVLGLPKDSPGLARLIEFAHDPAPRVVFDANLRRLWIDPSAPPFPVEKQPWAATGPMAATHFLTESREISHALPEPAFYPLDFDNRNLLIRPRRRHLVEQAIADEVYSIHFYGRRMRPRLAGEEGGAPRKGSYLDGLLQQYEIDPRAAPIL
ncbi:MAG: hypothetical protein ACPGGK_09420 [Pikeienuella sp.]